MTLIDENNQTIECIESCSPQYYQTSFNQNYCTNYCPTVYNNWNGVKLCQYNLQTCNEFSPFIYYASNDSKECVSQCQQSMKYYEYQNQKICTLLQDCNEVSKQYFNNQMIFQNYINTNLCQLECDFYIIQDQINKCDQNAQNCEPYPGYNYLQENLQETKNQCIKECINKVYKQNDIQICSSKSTCQDLNKKLENDLCVDECKKLHWQLQNNDKICINYDRCSQQSIYKFASFEDIQQCITQCQNNNVYYINSTNNEYQCTNFNDCSDNYINYMYIQLYNDTQCLLSCKNKVPILQDGKTLCIYDNTTCRDINMYNSNEICIQNCEKVYKMLYEENFCLTQCENDQFITSENDKLCTSECTTYKYTQDYINPICMDQNSNQNNQCKYKYYDSNECSDNCLGVYQEMQDNQKICYKSRSCNQYNLFMTITEAKKINPNLCIQQCSSDQIIFLSEKVCITGGCSSLNQSEFSSSSGRCLCSKRSYAQPNISNLEISCKEVNDAINQSNSTSASVKVNSCQPYLIQITNDQKQCKSDLSCQELQISNIIEQNQNSQYICQDCSSYNSEYYIFQNHTDQYCIKKCQDQYKYIKNNQSKECTSLCQYNYYQQDDKFICISESDKSKYKYQQEENTNQQQLLTDKMCQFIGYTQNGITICRSSSNCNTFIQHKILYNDQCQIGCDQKLVKDLFNNQLICQDDKCSQIYYYLQENICKQQCQNIYNESIYYQIVQNENVCIYDCTNNIFQLEDGKQCLNDCGQKYKFQIEQDRYICSECTYNTFIKNQSEYICVYSCQNVEILETSSNKNICLDQCNSNQYIYQKSCVQDCSQYNMYIDVDQKQCVYQCTSNRYYLQIEKYCIEEEKCKLNKNYQYLQQYGQQQCISQCQQYYYVQDNENICIDQCNVQTFIYLQGNQCVEQCQFNYYISLTNQCSQQKPQNCPYTIITNTIQCLQNCSNYNFIDIEEQTCIQTCDKYIKYQVQDTPICTQFGSQICQYYYQENNINICADECNIEGHLYLSDKQCIEECQPLQYSSVNRVCLDDKPQECKYMINTSFTQCLSNCQGYKYIDQQQQTCLTECTQYILYQENDLPICTPIGDQCNYYYIQNNLQLCIQSCGQLNMFAKENLCTDICDSGIYDYENIKCLDQCNRTTSEIQIQYFEPYKYVCVDAQKANAEIEEQFQQEISQKELKIKKQQNQIIILFVCIGFLAVFLILALILCCCKKKNQNVSNDDVKSENYNTNNRDYHVVQNSLEYPSQLPSFSTKLQNKSFSSQQAQQQTEQVVSQGFRDNNMEKQFDVAFQI